MDFSCECVSFFFLCICAFSSILLSYKYCTPMYIPSMDLPRQEKMCVLQKIVPFFSYVVFCVFFFENIVHIIRTWLTKKGVLYDNSVELYTSSDERSPMDILRKLIKFTTSLLMTEQQFREKNHFTVNYYPYHATNVFWWIS